MKKLDQIIIARVILVCGAEVKAQMVSDIVSVGPGYTNQAFYSMTYGELSNVTNTDWDLAFQIRGFAASILVNSKRGVNVWKTNTAESQWAYSTTDDSTGIVSDPAYQLFNSDTSCDFGALNRTNDASNQFDLGWGVYDFITHVITGDSIFFIKLGPTDYRKLRIDNLAGGIYNFRFANLDGSNEVVTYLNKTNLPVKLFGYSSI